MMGDSIGTNDEMGETHLDFLLDTLVEHFEQIDEASKEAGLEESYASQASKKRGCRAAKYIIEEDIALV